MELKFLYHQEVTDSSSNSINTDRALSKFLQIKSFKGNL